LETTMNGNKRDLLTVPVAAFVLLGWAGSLVVALLTREYTALSITTPLMLMLAGWVFGVSVVKRGTSDGDK
jgi:hypothetical protein